MSISAALNSAASGLNAAGRAAQAVSDNVANALTPGYAARQVDRASGQQGGVQITAVGRRETQSIISERRTAEAALGGASATKEALDRVARAVGTADDPASLTGRFAELSARLIEAQSRPDLSVRLDNLQTAFGDIVTHINAVGRTVQDQRLTADTNISNSVDLLNSTLDKVHDLNTRIVSGTARGLDVNTLLDQRRLAVDTISELVPVREMPREGGRISLITDTGTLILEGRPAAFAFTRTNGMSASMANGSPLSGLSIGGRPVDMTQGENTVSGGKIAAFFSLRDSTLPALQEKIDSVARDLIERFEATDLDPTTAPGTPGLFTDDGNSLGSPLEPGIAQRLSLNAAIDPASGGSTFRLRDGLGAPQPGEGGNSAFLRAISAAMETQEAPSDTSLTSSPLSVGGMMDTMLASANSASFQSTLAVSEAAGRMDVMQRAELSEGVNTDEEMRQLLLVEQSYAANARVIEVAGSMMQRILEI